MTGDDITRKEDLALQGEELCAAWEKGSVVKCLVIRDHLTKCFLGNVIPSKGVDDNKYATHLIRDAVALLDHTGVLLKCDNEPALKTIG